ncbi:hypothetical protein 1 [Changjiang picorna-like virus 7]|uniref:hypothetical protein 1 n=1 Tax=Changjiang picorna-like virus 7 TaxID=1922796 RepID=UPI0009096168|nr:hypothetical protein 1 [Changjiang picorna-like virus 7]APG79023.1 hypothetical protein 1 [Changjiang picorna-like virus 7]
MTFTFSPKNRSERQFSINAKVAKVVSNAQKESLLNGSAKQKRQFERLTKSEKREWRESLQRHISAIKDRLASRVMTGMKIRGKTMYRWKKLTQLEETLIENMDEMTPVELQTGLIGKAAIASGVALGAVAVAKAAQSVASATDSASKLVQASQGVVGKVDDLLSTFTASVTSFVERLKEFGQIIWKPCLIALAVWILTRYTNIPILASVVISAVGLFLPELTDMLTKYIPKAFKFQDGGLSTVADMITMMMTCWVPGNSAKSVTGEFMKRVSNFPRASDGMETFMKKVLGLVEQLINFVTQRSGDQRISLQGKLDAYQEWRNEVIEKMKFLAQNPMLPIEEIRKVKDLQITGLGFHQVMMTAESKRDLCYWMEKLNLALSPHEGAINAENNMRAMPVCIMLGGDSGVGKTTLLRYIASCILMLSKECSVKEALENMWQKGTTEYWNGYIGQKCLVMDDCFQVKPKAGDMDSEAMQFIRGVGNWSMPLNFADLGSKGKIYLDSPLVIGTTNCRNVHAEWAPFITEPKALVRRFQTAAWVRVRPDFAIEGRFDFDKVNGMFASAIEEIVSDIAARKERGDGMPTANDILDKLPWHVWDMYVHTFDRENIGDTMYPGGLRAVIQNAADDIIKRKEVNRKEIKDMTKLLQALDDCMIETQTGLEEARLRVQQAAQAERLVTVGTFPLPEIEEVDSPRIQPGFVFNSDAERFQHEQQFASYERMVDRGEQSFATQLLYRREHQQALNELKEAEKEHENFFLKFSRLVNSWIQNMLERFHLHHILGDNSQYILKLGLTSIAAYTITTAIIKIAVGIVGAVCSVFRFITNMFGMRGQKIDDDEEPKEKKQEIKMASFNETVKSQVGVPPREDVYDIIFANTLKCRTDDAVVGQFVGLGSDVFLFPKHYLIMMRQMNEDIELEFTAAKDGRKMRMTIGDFLCLKMIEMPGFDIAGVAFGRCFAKANRKIVKFFLTQHELKNVMRGGNTPVRLDVATYNKDHSLRQRTLYSPTCYYHGKAMDQNTNTELDGLVQYVANTVAGDCGAPLTIAEARNYDARCILGFHSAGRDAPTGRLGYSTLISQEVAREMFNNLKTYEDLVNNHTEFMTQPVGTARVEMQTELQEKGLVRGSFELLGTLHVPVNAPSKTKLKPSAMNEDKLFGPCPVAPAVLSAKEVDGVVKEPMIEGLKAYQTPLQYRNPAQLRPIVDMAMERHWEATKHFSRDILGFEEAIKAPVGWKLKPINRKTSPGYIWSDYVTPKTPGKTAFFGHEGEYEFDYDNNKALDSLRTSTWHIIMEAEQGRREVHLCTDFLKDELRPIYKVQNVATRVISATPVDYTIVVRQYFGAFLAAMFATHVENGMAPGINQYTGWYKLATALKGANRKSVFDGDFSRFDASEQPWIHEGILDYINRWYRFNNPNWTQEQENVRNVLWLDLVHSRHISGFGNQLQYVVQWNKSLPSGHPLTTAVNSMYSLITLTGCYVRATGDSTDMWSHAFLNTFGDDNITAVDDEMKDRFNQVTVAGLMKDMFDLTYTPGDKSGVLVPYTDLEECTFLKRSFKIDDAVFNRLTLTGQNFGWVGPLAEESWLFTGYWYKNARSPVTDMVSRLEFSLCELCLHSEEKWNEIFPKLQTWCCRNGIPLKLTSREATRSFVSERMDVWF